MIEKLLPQLLLHIVVQGEVILEKSIPEGMIASTDSIVSRRKESAAIQSVESRNKTSPLEENQEGTVVGVGIQRVDKGRRRC